MLVVVGVVALVGVAALGLAVRQREQQLQQVGGSCCNDGHNGGHLSGDI